GSVYVSAGNPSADRAASSAPRSCATCTALMSVPALSDASVYENVPRPASVRTAATADRSSVTCAAFTASELIVGSVKTTVVARSGALSGDGHDPPSTDRTA